MHASVEPVPDGRPRRHHFRFASYYRWARSCRWRPRPHSPYCARVGRAGARRLTAVPPVPFGNASSSSVVAAASVAECSARARVGRAGAGRSSSPLSLVACALPLDASDSTSPLLRTTSGIVEVVYVNRGRGAECSACSASLLRTSMWPLCRMLWMWCDAPLHPRTCSARLVPAVLGSPQWARRWRRRSTVVPLGSPYLTTHRARLCGDGGFPATLSINSRPHSTCRAGRRCGPRPALWRRPVGVGSV